MKIGVVYGNPETTTGGNALKFYASVRLDIRRKKPLKRGDDTIGSECKVKVVKNKMAPPFREADFEILYGTGINKGGELVDTAEKLGLVEKSGTWYAYAGERLGQGREGLGPHRLHRLGALHGRRGVKEVARVLRLLHLQPEFLVARMQEESPQEALAGRMPAHELGATGSVGLGVVVDAGVHGALGVAVGLLVAPDYPAWSGRTGHLRSKQRRP
jgi:hypothetical protein